MGAYCDVILWITNKMVFKLLAGEIYEILTSNSRRVKQVACLFLRYLMNSSRRDIYVYWTTTKPLLEEIKHRFYTF